MLDFTVADVLAWARTKPADEKYTYGSNRDCALCQFLKETGRCSNPGVGGDYWRNRAARPSVEIPFPDGLQFALLAPTFGALVTKLQAVVGADPAASPASIWTNADAYLAEIEQVR